MPELAHRGASESDQLRDRTVGTGGGNERNTRVKSIPNAVTGPERAVGDEWIGRDDGILTHDLLSSIQRL